MSLIRKLAGQITPDFIKPYLLPIYWRYYRFLADVDFSEQQFESLNALRCSIAYNKYGAYCIPDSSKHRSSALIVAANAVYEPETIAFMAANCGTGDIVHAGTYFGDFLPALSKAVAQDAIVWAFEPNVENFRCATITMLLNEISNVTLRNAGLGAVAETLFLQTVDDSGTALGGGSQVVSTSNNDALQSVQILPIDESVPRNRTVSILQLDVEGYERPALEGALQTIQRCKPMIIIEILPNSELITGKWFAENILALGYQNTHKVSENLVFTCSETS